MRPSWTDSRLITGIAGTLMTWVLGVFCALKVDAQPAVTPENVVAPLDEIVVTASKRVSTVQDTPISITAVTGSDLLARGVSSLGNPCSGHTRRFAEERGAEPDGDRNARHDLERRQLRDGRVLSG